MCVDLPLGKKTVENTDWATRPPGRRGPWAVGRWAASLLLPNPLFLAEAKLIMIQKQKRKVPELRQIHNIHIVKYIISIAKPKLAAFSPT